MTLPSAKSDDHSVVFIIFNSIPPYAFEANNILALPDGMSYRARFRAQWHPTIANPKDVENRDGIILLRNWDTGQIFPLRRIRTTSIDPVGDVFYINYTLANLMEYDSDEQVRSDQVINFNERLAVELKPYANEAKADLVKLIFLGPDLTVGISDTHRIAEESQREFNDWGKIIGLIGNFGCFIDIDFLKIIRISDESHKRQGLIRAEGSERYFLTNNRVYSLDLFQRSYTQKTGDSSVSPRTITLGSESDAVTLIREQFAVSGKYDRFSFRFRTHILDRVRDTDLAVEIRRADNKGPMPTIYVPIRIATPLRAVVGRAGALTLFIAGLLLLSFSDQISPQNSSLAQRIGIFAMVITSIESREFIGSLLDRIRTGFAKR